MFGRLIRLTIGAFVATAIGAAVAALVTKQRTPSVGVADSDEIALVAIFEPLEFASTAKAFRGGSVLCWYGGGDIDLRDATLDPAGGHLTLKAIFGGGQLLVPDEWDVDLRMTAIFGGVGDAREARVRPADAPRLVIDGFALFGGFGVDSSKRDVDIDVAELIESGRNGIKDAVGRAKDKADQATDQAAKAVSSAADAVADAAEDATKDATEKVPALDV